MSPTFWAGRTGESGAPRVFLSQEDRDEWMSRHADSFVVEMQQIDPIALLRGGWSE